MQFDIENKEWMKQGLCAYHPDPDLWHYESSVFEDERLLQIMRIAEAKSICMDCPVKQQCLAEGMKDENLTDTSGYCVGSIWGGMMAGERSKIKQGKYTHKYKIELKMLRPAMEYLAKIRQ